MNKKGFTLVELLAVILIIGIIAGIGTFTYVNILSGSRKRIYSNYEQNMLQSTKMYMIDNTFPENNNSLNLSLTTLINNGYLTNIINPINKQDLCLSSYVLVTNNNPITGERENNNINLNYKICLICQDYTSTGC